MYLSMYSKPQIKCKLPLAIAVVLKIHDAIAFATFRLLYRRIDSRLVMADRIVLVCCFAITFALLGYVYFYDAITVLTGKKTGNSVDIVLRYFPKLSFNSRMANKEEATVIYRALPSSFPMVASINPQISNTATHHINLCCISVGQRSNLHSIYARYKQRSRTCDEQSSDNDEPSVIPDCKIVCCLVQHTKGTQSCSVVHSSIAESLSKIMLGNEWNDMMIYFAFPSDAFFREVKGQPYHIIISTVTNSKTSPASTNNLFRGTQSKDTLHIPNVMSKSKPSRVTEDFMDVVLNRLAFTHEK
uniref:Uncharacterized protein n=1 Tax=Glossina pallidipes TaxID=7398 RepID=A0A1B0AK43_GLOPL